MPDSILNNSAIKSFETAGLKNGARQNFAIISACLILLCLLSYALFTLPNLFQGNAKILFKNEAQISGQLELLSSDTLLERLAAKMHVDEWTGANGTPLNSSMLDKVLINLGLKRDVNALDSKQKIIELLKNGVSYEQMANAPVMKISFVSTLPNLAAQVPNLIAKEYLQMVKSANFIKARQVQSSSRATLDDYHFSFGFTVALIVGGVAMGVIGFLLSFSGAIKNHLSVRKRQKAAEVEMPKISVMPRAIAANVHNSPEFEYEQVPAPQHYWPHAA